MADDGRRGDGEDRGPGAAHQVFVVMESLLEKLRVLNYEEEVLSRHNLKSLSRHYFVSCPSLASNPGEQFFTFTVTAAWLLGAAGRPFPEPREDDDPTATVANILSELRGLGVKVDFPPSRLKSGSGEHVCFVLDRLAEEVLRRRGFSLKRPKYPTETTEEESVTEEDAELTLSRMDEEPPEEPEDDEENLVDLDALKLRTSHLETDTSSKPEEILQSTVEPAEWNLELERVLPQLRVTVRTDNKDWRIHVDQMHQHQDGIRSSLKEAKAYLDKLQDDVGKVLEKVSSREKYINNQLEQLIQEYRSAQAKLSQVKERHQQASGGVAERTRVLAEISEDLDKVKQEMEEKGSRMSDGAPVVKIRQSVTKLKQELLQMEVRIGVVEHTLVQAKLKEKSNMARDMHGLPEANAAAAAAGPFA